MIVFLALIGSEEVDIVTLGKGDVCLFPVLPAAEGLAEALLRPGRAEGQGGEYHAGFVLDQEVAAAVESIPPEQRKLVTFSSHLSGQASEFNVRLDGYRTNLSTTGMELDVDLVTDEVTRAVGNMDGDIDIPNFPVDGNFDIEGLGDKLAVAIDVAVTDIDFDVNLSDLF